MKLACSGQNTTTGLDHSISKDSPPLSTPQPQPQSQPQPQTQQLEPQSQQQQQQQQQLQPLPQPQNRQTSQPQLQNQPTSQPQPQNQQIPQTSFQNSIFRNPSTYNSAFASYLVPIEAPETAHHNGFNVEENPNLLDLVKICTRGPYLYFRGCYNEVYGKNLRKRSAFDVSAIHVEGDFAWVIFDFNSSFCEISNLTSPIRSKILEDLGEYMKVFDEDAHSAVLNLHNLVNRRDVTRRPNRKSVVSSAFQSSQQTVHIGQNFALNNASSSDNSSNATTALQSSLNANSVAEENKENNEVNSHQSAGQGNKSQLQKKKNTGPGHQLNGPNTRSRHQVELENNHGFENVDFPDSPDYETIFHPSMGYTSRDRTKTRILEIAEQNYSNDDDDPYFDATPIQVLNSQTMPILLEQFTKKMSRFSVQVCDSYKDLYRVTRRIFKENSILNDRYHDLRCENSRLSSSVLAYRQEIEGLKRSLTNQHSSVEELETQLDILASELHVMSAEKGKLYQQLEESKLKQKRLAEAITSRAFPYTSAGAASALAKAAAAAVVAAAAASHPSFVSQSANNHSAAGPSSSSVSGFLAVPATSRVNNTLAAKKAPLETASSLVTQALPSQQQSSGAKNATQNTDALNHLNKNRAAGQLPPAPPSSVEDSSGAAASDLMQNSNIATTSPTIITQQSVKRAQPLQAKSRDRVKSGEHELLGELQQSQNRIRRFSETISASTSDQPPPLKLARTALDGLASQTKKKGGAPQPQLVKQVTAPATLASSSSSSSGNSSDRYRGLSPKRELRNSTNFTVAAPASWNKTHDRKVIPQKRRNEGGAKADAVSESNIYLTRPGGSSSVGGPVGGSQQAKVSETLEPTLDNEVM